MDLVTVSEAAALFKVSTGFLYKNLERLPHYRCGGDIRFDRQELIDHFKRQPRVEEK